MTGWADVGLVAIGGATTLLGGALEGLRAERRDRAATSDAAVAARNASDLANLVALYEGLLASWPDGVSLYFHSTRKADVVTAYAAQLGQLKGRAMRLRDTTLREQVRTWIRALGALAIGAKNKANDAKLDELGDELTDLMEQLSVRILELEGQS